MKIVQKITNEVCKERKRIGRMTKMEPKRKENRYKKKRIRD
jgi:hypothetical protein